MMEVNEDEEVIELNLETVLPSGFHWDNEKPTVIKNEETIIITSIPTRKFTSNQSSYGHLIYKISLDILGCVLCSTKTIKTRRGSFDPGISHIATNHKDHCCFIHLTASYVKSVTDAFSRA